MSELASPCTETVSSRLALGCVAHVVVASVLRNSPLGRAIRRVEVRFTRTRSWVWRWTGWCGLLRRPASHYVTAVITYFPMISTIDLLSIAYPSVVNAANVACSNEHVALTSIHTVSVWDAATLVARVCSSISRPRVYAATYDWAVDRRVGDRQWLGNRILDEIGEGDVHGSERICQTMLERERTDERGLVVRSEPDVSGCIICEVVDVERSPSEELLRIISRVEHVLSVSTARSGPQVHTADRTEIVRVDLHVHLILLLEPFSPTACAILSGTGSPDVHIVAEFDIILEPQTITSDVLLAEARDRQRSTAHRNLARSARVTTVTSIEVVFADTDGGSCERRIPITQIDFETEIAQFSTTTQTALIADRFSSGTLEFDVRLFTVDLLILKHRTPHDRIGVRTTRLKIHEVVRIDTRDPPANVRRIELSVVLHVEQNTEWGLTVVIDEIGRSIAFETDEERVRTAAVDGSLRRRSALTRTQSNYENGKQYWNQVSHHGSSAKIIRSSDTCA